jgi:hypothetical protein
MHAIGSALVPPGDFDACAATTINIEYTHTNYIYKQICSHLGSDAAPAPFVRDGVLLPLAALEQIRAVVQN